MTRPPAPPSNGPPARRWRPSPLLAASVALHGIAALVLVAALVALAVGAGHAPAAAAGSGWPARAIGLALAALAVDHLALTAAGLWPRCRLLGPNRVRLPPAAAARGEIAITIDDGPDPVVTPAVLDQLAAAGARATFFVIAERAARHPDLLARIVAGGHAIGNHSDRHSHRFSFSGPRGFATEIGRAQVRLALLTGRAPRFFRAPAGLRNPFLEPVLCRYGLMLASWTRRGFDTREANPDTVFARLAGPAGERLAAGDILLLHDGHAARDTSGRPVILAVLPRLLAACAARGLHPVTLDAADASPADASPADALPADARPADRRPAADSPAAP